MKQIFLTFILLSFLFSCNQKKSSEEKENIETKTKIYTVDTSSEKNSNNTKLIDPDSDDGVPPKQYSPRNSNIEVASKIRIFLTDDLLKNDLKPMTTEQRKFQYEEVDLNEDGKKEYLVGFNNSYFCGSGGCTFYLLNNDGTVITIFTVSDAPFIALKSKTNGWRDLLVNSDGALRSLKYDGKTYPANPSVAPKFNHTPSDDAYRLLWDEFPIPNFKF